MNQIKFTITSQKAYALEANVTDMNIANFIVDDKETTDQKHILG